MATVKLDPAKGIQIPNLTTTERNAISSPETGAIIWNTTTSEINQYNGSAWEITYTPVAGITSSADATAITIDSSERVGVGTTTHHDNATKLTVAGRINTSNGTATGSMNYGGGSVVNMGALTNHPVNLMINNSTKWVIDTNGNLIAEGGGGIVLGNTSYAAANELDDYEEGTWTPTLATGTLSGAYGNYIKIGKMCYISFHLSNFSDKSTNANVTIRGIPFTIGGTFNIGTVIAYQNGNSNPLNLITGSTTSEFHMYQMYNASSWSLQNHNTLGGDPNFYCYGGYQVA